jgi:hypothetical protein
MEEDAARKVIAHLQEAAAGDPRILFCDGLYIHCSHLFNNPDIEPDIARELEHELDILADSPKKDFHPFTDQKIQDLIHPSLYPYVHNHSKLPWRSRDKVKKYSESKGTQFS